MDDSKVRRAHGYTGAVVEHRRFGGAHVSRIMHPPGQRIDAHGHDWPVLAIYRMGSYRESGEIGEAHFDGPSVVFQPAGAAHADDIGDWGLETLAMTFDPAWLPDIKLPERTCWRPGGSISLSSRSLAATWLSADARTVQEQTARFLRAMLSAQPQPRRPAWAEHIDEALGRGERMAAIASSARRHPAWLARAWRQWRGEGIAETTRRRRVERASVKLRMSAAPLAEIAVECGFCDQSHMNRAFRALLGRTPLEVRQDAPLLAPLMRAAGCQRH